MFFYIRNSKVEFYELRLGNEESKKANLDNLAKLADINKEIENFDIKIETVTVSFFFVFVFSVMFSFMFFHKR